MRKELTGKRDVPVCRKGCRETVGYCELQFCSENLMFEARLSEQLHLKWRIWEVINVDISGKMKFS